MTSFKFGRFVWLAQVINGEEYKQRRVIAVIAFSQRSADAFLRWTVAPLIPLKKLAFYHAISALNIKTHYFKWAPASYWARPPISTQTKPSVLMLITGDNDHSTPPAHTYGLQRETKVLFSSRVLIYIVFLFVYFFQFSWCLKKKK